MANLKAGNRGVAYYQPYSYRSRRNRYNRRTRLRRTRRSTRSRYESPYWNSRYYSYGQPRRFRRTRIERSDDGSDSSEAEEVREVELVKELHVKEVDLNVRTNTEAHYTDRYEVPKDELVIRRGQEFTVTITWDRPYDKRKNDVQLVFTKTGGSDAPGTEEKMLLDESGTRRSNPKNWHARLVETRGKETDVEIYTPCNCVIGEWKMKVLTMPEGSDGKKVYFSYEHNTEITILFNPWCKDDQCYYKEDKKDLNEYVLNEKGCQYKGNSRRMYAVAWDYGQFDKDQLDICLYLLKKGFNDDVNSKLSDPVKVSRAITKMVNSNDEDNGVLLGKWGGDYRGGTKPGAWGSSADILNEWKTSKFSPVKYGQCWVFSAVTTAVCRAIGLPCRSVTNFASAHDTEGSATIDKYYDEDGVPLERETDDSVWNFHVWNEIYIARPDLPRGYDGWQVIDATPQERSDGVFQCGPSPVIGVKNGECVLPYDTTFVFAEVNGDIVNWEKRAPGVYVVSKIDTRGVGKNISTKFPDGKRFRGQRWNRWEDRKHRLDLTLDYKYREGSEEEHRAVLNARREEHLPGVVKELYVKIEDPGEVVVGDDVEFDIKVKNISRQDELRTVESVAVTIQSESYTGHLEEILKQQTFGEFSLNPEQRKSVSVKLKAEEYEPHMSEDSMIKIVAVVHCKETGESTMDEDDFRFLRPDVEIKMADEARLGEKVEVKLSFWNPLHRPLTECELHVDVSHSKRMVIPQRDVRARQTWKDTATITASRVGELQVTAIFKCRELDDIRDTRWLTVTRT